MDATWPTGLQKAIRLRNGFHVHLDLQDWSQRRTYFSGAYYQSEIEGLLDVILQRGDAWVDIGANIGMVTLMAAAKVGRPGSGVAIEPNPLAFERLLHHVKLNHLDWISCKNVAAGSAHSTATLAFNRSHVGAGSLVAPKSTDQVEINVEVKRGDDLVKAESGQALVIKIDVEGYELEVLAGLSATLRHQETALVIEVVDEFLRRAGGSAAELLHHLLSRGYQAYSFELSRRRWGRCLVIRRIDTIREGSKCDILFVNKNAVSIRSRIRSLVQDSAVAT